MPPSCALLVGFAIGARFALLWQHNANPSYKCERVMLASAVYSLFVYVARVCVDDRSDGADRVLSG